MDIAGRTDTGLVRTNNEDCIGVDADLGALVLADGMGGLNAGEHASAETVRTVLRVLREQPEPLDGCLRTAVDRANERVWALSRSVPGLANMGTTVVVFVRHAGRSLVAHVGDSRAYRWRDGKLSPLTIDHSLVQQLIEEGVIDPADAHKAPNRNIITRAVGIEGSVDVDVQEADVVPGDCVLLCSDGLSDMIDDAAIAQILRASDGDLQNAADALIAAARSYGGFDNISVLLARIES